MNISNSERGLIRPDPSKERGTDRGVNRPPASALNADTQGAKTRAKARADIARLQHAIESAEKSGNVVPQNILLERDQTSYALSRLTGTLKDLIGDYSIVRALNLHGRPEWLERERLLSSDDFIRTLLPAPGVTRDELRKQISDSHECIFLYKEENIAVPRYLEEYFNSAVDILGQLPGTPTEKAEDLITAYKYGVEDRPSYKIKSGEVTTLLVEEARKRRTLSWGAADAGYWTRGIDDKFGTHASCTDPTQLKDQVVKLPPIDKELRSIVQEMVKAESIHLVVTLKSQMIPDRWEVKETGVNYARSFEKRDKRDPSDKTAAPADESSEWIHRRGWAQIEPGTSDEETKSSAESDGGCQTFEALKTLHDPHLRPNPAQEKSDQQEVELRFNKSRNELLSVVRVFREVLGRALPEFGAKFNAGLDKLIAEITTWKPVGVDIVGPRLVVTPIEKGKLPPGIPGDVTKEGDGSTIRNMPPPEEKELTEHYKKNYPEVISPPAEVQSYMLEMSEEIYLKIKDMAEKAPTIRVKPHFVHFPHGKDQPDEGGLRELETATRQLRSLASEFKVPLALSIKGYADKTGDTFSNFELSDRRAKYVEKSLKGTLGKLITTSRIGCGDTFAPEKKHSPEHRVAVILFRDSLLFE